MLEDQRLLRRLRSRDKDALSRIYEKYIDDLLRVAMSLLHDIQTAQDCLHDVFVNLASGADQLTIRGNVKKYMVSCVANRARDMLRKSAKHPDCQLEQPEPAEIMDNPVDKLITSEESARVFTALKQLPYQQREVFVLRVQGGLKFREIAALLGTSTNTAQSRYRYGIQKLRTILQNGEQK